MRTTIGLLMAGSLLLAACENQNEELAMRNQELQQQLAAKDQFINEVTSTISDIHNEVETAWAEHKKIVRKAKSVEAGEAITHAELKKQIVDRIEGMRSALAENRKRMNTLERKLKASETSYTGLNDMMADLKATLEEREKSMAELWGRIRNLEGELVAKNDTIASQEMVINDQKRKINTGYYVVGQRDSLRTKGIIDEEGGFPWGLFGSTTVLADNLTEEYFHPVEKSVEMIIPIYGTIDEIVPRRDEATYIEERRENGEAVLRIIKPDKFWQQRHLVIVSN
ncbi:MAG TPA: hypothetical protein VGA55_09360 [Bacteroidota bacterium]